MKPSLLTAASKLSILAMCCLVGLAVGCGSEADGSGPSGLPMAGAAVGGSGASATAGGAGAAGSGGASAAGSAGAGGATAAGASAGGSETAGSSAGGAGTAGASGGSGGTGGGTGGTGGGGMTPTAGAAGSAGSAGSPPVDPKLPLTPVAFYPAKAGKDVCADASIAVEFNRPPVIKSGAKLEIHEASDAVFDSVTSNVTELYFSDLVTRGAFKTDALDVVFSTVVYLPKAALSYGKTYYVTIDEGMITDALGTKFSVKKSDNWTFTVRAQRRSSAATLTADGSGDYCSLTGLLDALPDTASAPRIIQVGPGVYPGIVRSKDSQVHFRGAGVDRTIFSHKNAATMNSDREGIELSGSDLTFEKLTIFNTYLRDSSGQQAEALYVTANAKRVFLDDVHLRSHQDTLRVDGQVYMKGGKISGSTDPLWGTGAFYCDGCELMSRTSGHAFVVARSTLGFALVNCRVTKETAAVANTLLAQYHAGKEPGRIAYVGCAIDDHVVGWRDPGNNAWYEYGNTKLQGGGRATYNGKQLSASDPVLASAQSAKAWLGWAP